MPEGDALLSQFDFTRNKNWAAAFLGFDAAGFLRLLRTRDEAFWQRAGERRALTLFHAASRRVPAYRDFLKKHKVRPERVRTIADFAQVPPTDKWNYVKAYPLHRRVWDGNVAQADLVAVSSGTSGEPTFWPRGGFQEFEAGVIHELIYRSLFEIHKRKTLLLIGFPMGVYVSGIATVIPSWLVGQKGYDLTLVTAGNNKPELLRAVEHLKKEYEQVVLVGHPFFIKDVLETGREQGIKWRDRRVRMMFCSEGFSEPWREFVIRQAGVSPTLTTAISTYGSSEFLLMAHEMPFTVGLRKRLMKDAALLRELFGDKPLPNLFQYNPFFRYIESVNDELIFTSASGVPLIRFNLHDSGRVLPLGTVRGAKPNAWQLPLVALWGRSDQTLVFYAANIYPEHIKLALEERQFLRKLTGKFVMRKGYLRNMDEYLEINIELKKGLKPAKTLARRLTGRIVKKLEAINMEYLFLRTHLDKNLVPKVVLWPYQSEKYFRPGLKPRYIHQEKQ